MSLDISLYYEKQKQSVKEKIFIREDGQTKEISREEWDQRFPDREPCIAVVYEGEVFEYNITHNLTQMAAAAGIFYPIWKPETINITKAEQLIPFLSAGLMVLESDPEYFKRFNPANGWGNYENLVSFVKAYLTACKEFPGAKVMTEG